MWDDDPETRPGSDRQWWLTEGPGYCFVCEVSVHPEMLVHCVECDQAVCPLCLDDSPTGRGLGICPECAKDLDREAR